MSQPAPDNNEEQHGQAAGAAAVVRFAGQRDEQGRVDGFGCEVDAEGQMIAGRCGVWNEGVLVEQRAVPMSHLPADLLIEMRARGAVLLRDDGSWYRGQLDEEYRAHGVGVWFDKVDD